MKYAYYGIILVASSILATIFIAHTYERRTKGICIDNSAIPGNFAIDKLATTGNIVYVVDYSETDNHVKIYRPKNGGWDYDQVDIVSCHQLIYGNHKYKVVELNYQLMLERNIQ